MIRPPATERRKRVVIVDDSRVMQAVLERMLGGFGLDVVGFASDVEAAVRTVSDLRPDLVTIDLVLGDSNGMQLIERLVDAVATRKVIIASQAASGAATAAQLRALGVGATIDKRDLIDRPDRVAATIRAVLAEAPVYASACGTAGDAPGAEADAGTVAGTAPGTGPGTGTLPICPVPVDEAVRIAEVALLGLNNSVRDDALDLVTAHLAINTEFSSCLMTFIDADTQWIKSAYGFDAPSTPRSHAFCNYTICQDDVFVVKDTARDDRFRNHPLVTGDPEIRTYVGHPIVGATGTRLGALCLIDKRPRAVTDELLANVRRMAAIASALIEARTR